MNMFSYPVKKDLRQYQINAIAMVRQSFISGNRRVVVNLPTGGGKTLTAAKIIEGARNKGKRVIFTAPAISLIDQTVNAFEDEGLTGIGVMQASHPRTDKHAPLQIASVQTLARREIPEAALIIVDEAHIRSEAIDKLMDDRPDVFFIGLSATPWAKGMGIRWQDLIVPVTIGELIRDGYLSEFRAFGPDVPDLSGVKTVAGEYAEEALAAVMGEADLIGSVVNNWLEHGENRPTLCFAVNRAHAAQIQTEFARQGVSAGYVDAMTDIVHRKHINAQFRNGDIRVICSVRTMTTGVDLPVSCIIDAAPTKSEMLHVQKIGRGLRVNPGTEDCVIFDHAGNSIRLGLVTDIRHDRLDDTVKGKQERKAAAEKLPKECKVCGVLHSGLTCPGCGNERKPVAGVETADGVLVQIGGKKVVPTMDDKQAFWSMALHVDRSRSKGGKLAKGLYKGKYGVWPKGLKDAPREPDLAFMNYERSRRIAYAKSKGAV